ncbi:LacI family transcriptional regulator [Endozoicomonas sp. Mp262]|uniref:LacI family DNA-binding transcriptional regulator n=1 Tax=Endozoicomonas sp. Mp262 TaxID=2919499 RepID=UPI0021D84345
MNKPKIVNSTQIARLAGVSRSTVSKVINNYPEIPEETKEKVQAVIKEHRYTPNTSARVLKGKAQDVIALYVYASAIDSEADSLCQLGSHYVMGVISNFIMAANQQDHRIMIELLKYGEDEQEVLHRIQGHFESKSIAAAAFLGLPVTPGFIDRLVAENLPIAVIDRPVDTRMQAVNIYTDDYQGMQDATHHLINKGYRRIAFISGDRDKYSARMRAEGYHRAMEKYNLNVNVISGEYSEKSGANAADTLLAMAPRPDAVVCASDAIAYGLIQRLHLVDQDYLKKLGLVGFDDNAFNDFQYPPLSSVKVDFAAMAHRTVSALLKPETFDATPIPIKLVVRASSASFQRR